MSSFFDVFWNRNITSVVDAEESTRKEKEREAEQQLIADILCQDGFHSRHRLEEKKQDDGEQDAYEYELIEILSYRSFSHI